MARKLSTVSDLDEGRPAAALAARRLVLVAVLLLVGAGLGGLLGVRTEATTRTGQGYTLRLDYPASGRSGLDARWQVRVEHPDGFEDKLTLAVTGDYFDIFETQGFFPEPSETTRDGETLYLTFDSPEGTTFLLDYDAYIQPASQQGRSAHLAVVDSPTGGNELVGLDYTTRLVP